MRFKGTTPPQSITEGAKSVGLLLIFCDNYKAIRTGRQKRFSAVISFVQDKEMRFSDFFFLIARLQNKGTHKPNDQRVKTRAAAPANNFYPQKRERKKKKKKKRYTLQTARRAAAVKVFRQNTTRSVARCGDCAQNPQGLTFTAGKRNGYLCIFIFFWRKTYYAFFIFLLQLICNFLSGQTRRRK